jgi:uncharacterized protein (DUF1499 family)
MTQKEKAVELFKKFYGMPNNSKTRIKNIEFDTAKKCALIAVDEVLNVLPQSEYLEDTDEYHENRERLYWKDVKQEIEKL